jgi:hypothetical protein
MKFDRRTADAFYRVSFGAFAYAAYAVLHPNKPLVPNWHIKCFAIIFRRCRGSLRQEVR